MVKKKKIVKSVRAALDWALPHCGAPSTIKRIAEYLAAREVELFRDLDDDERLSAFWNGVGPYDPKGKDPKETIRNLIDILAASNKGFISSESWDDFQDIVCSAERGTLEIW